MDIAAHWITWGWFIGLQYISMAVTITSARSDAVCLLGILLLLTFFALHPQIISTSTTPASASVSARELQSSSSNSKTSAATVRFHPKQQQLAQHNTTSFPFETAEHNVPSGPNPESNK